jgi:hypothetical protein
MIGNPYAYCYNEPVPECKLDQDCPSQTACIQNTCSNPCTELKPCKPSARCSILDTIPVRTMVCSCPESYIPDENGECKSIPLVKIGCSHDDECSNSESCINGQCRNPCNCGLNAECTVQKHRPICSCINGYEGNPNLECRSIGCTSDSECEHDKTCINKNCINVCLIDNPCAPNAECYARNHKSECRCANGYRGNPLISCQNIECRSNNDCPSDKGCINERCVSLCVYDNKCALRAECFVQNHFSLCKCLLGLIGNPYIECKPEEKPECTVDVDCPGALACIDNKCVDVCHKLAPCIEPAKCQAIASVPVRTMICVCPEGYISSGSGTCKKIEIERVIGCIADSDCVPEQACVNNLCRSPCNCGPNSECRIKEHKPVRFFLKNLLQFFCNIVIFNSRYVHASKVTKETLN